MFIDLWIVVDQRWWWIATCQAAEAVQNIWWPVLATRMKDVEDLRQRGWWAARSDSKVTTGHERREYGGREEGEREERSSSAFELTPAKRRPIARWRRGERKKRIGEIFFCVSTTIRFRVRLDSKYFSNFPLFITLTEHAS